MKILAMLAGGKYIVLPLVKVIVYPCRLCGTSIEMKQVKDKPQFVDGICPGCNSHMECPK